MMAARELFEPEHTVIQYDHDVDFYHRVFEGGWMLNDSAKLTLLGGGMWTNELELGPLELPSCPSSELESMTGKLIIAKYEVEGRTSWGPRHVQSVKREGDVYRLVLAWPKGLINSYDPPEVLKYAFKRRGKEEPEYLYQPDAAGRAVRLVRYSEVYTVEKKLRALWELLQTAINEAGCISQLE